MKTQFPPLEIFINGVVLIFYSCRFFKLYRVDLVFTGTKFFNSVALAKFILQLYEFKFLESATRLVKV